MRVLSWEEHVNYEITRQVSDNFTGNIVDVALSSWAVWEYIITVDQECTLIWRSKTKRSLVSALFVSLRWCLLAQAAIIVFPAAQTTWCKAGVVFTNVTISIGYIQIALFSALRASALWGNNLLLFLVLFFFGSAPLATKLQILNIYISHSLFLPAPESMNYLR